MGNRALNRLNLVKRGVLVVILLFATSPLLFSQTASGVSKSEDKLQDQITQSHEQLYHLSQTQALPTLVNEGEFALASSKSKFKLRRERKDSLRATRKVWVSILGGPSYTPEASLGAAVAALASFRISSKDTVSQRSFLPIGINFSVNGTLVIAGAGSLFFNENSFRIYSNYGYRREPVNYYGKGIEQVDATTQAGEDVGYMKETVQFFPRFVWRVLPKFFAGALVDINYNRMWDYSALMQSDSYVNSFKTRYTNIGLGAMLQYDTRDDVATPFKGVYLNVMPKVYAKAFGGSYNYQIYELEYRQFQPLFKRATLAWVARTQIGNGDVPFTELPTFGSPFDLRGFYVGQYRDNSMAYGIVEFRHMFGSWEDYQKKTLLSKFGYVAWIGAGSVASKPQALTQWKLNYGGGVRVQIQPGKNFRLDIGKGAGVDGVLVYFNMTEAF